MRKLRAGQSMLYAAGGMPAPLHAQDPSPDVTRLERRLAQLASLMEVSRLVGSSLDLGEVLDRVMRKAQDVVGAEAGAILLMNERTGKLEIEVALGAGIPVGELKKKLVLAPGQGITGSVRSRARPSWCRTWQRTPASFARPNS